MSSFQLLLLGGDARYLEMIDTLCQDGMKLTVVGWDKQIIPTENVTKQSLHELDFSRFDAIMFPVSGVNDRGEVDLAPFATEKIYITTDMLDQTNENCVIYTGISTPFLERLTSLTDKQLVCLFKRDDLAVMNSIPTAEGSLQLAMENTDTTIHGMDVLILGFGRVGKSLAHLFHAVGANVTVGIHHARDEARIYQLGMQSLYTNNLEEKIHPFQLIINTVPHLLLTASVLTNLNKDRLIIDLASSPGGTDFSFAEKQGITALHARGIPGKVAPKTAGKIIAKVFWSHVHEPYSK